jgi:hypothetical protein
MCVSRRRVNLSDCRILATRAYSFIFGFVRSAAVIAAADCVARLARDIASDVTPTGGVTGVTKGAKQDCCCPCLPPPSPWMQGLSSLGGFLLGFWMGLRLL